MTIPRIRHQFPTRLNIDSENLQASMSWNYWNKNIKTTSWDQSKINHLLNTKYPFLAQRSKFTSETLLQKSIQYFLILREYGGIIAHPAVQYLTPFEVLTKGELVISHREEGRDFNNRERSLKSQDKYGLFPILVATSPMEPRWDQFYFEWIKIQDNLSDDVKKQIENTERLINEFRPSSNNKSFYTRTKITIEEVATFSHKECDSGLIFDLDFWINRISKAKLCCYETETGYTTRFDAYYGFPGNTETSITQAKYKKAIISSNNYPNKLPFISCLLVMQDPKTLPGIIKSFSSQTYPVKELVIVDITNSTLTDSKAWSESIRICKARNLNHNISQFEALDIAREYAHGDFVCLWPSDSIFDPLRLEVQYQILAHAHANASYLSTRTLIDKVNSQINHETARNKIDTLMCETSLLPRLKGLSPSKVQSIMDDTISSAEIKLPRLWITINPNLADTRKGNYAARSAEILPNKTNNFDKLLYQLSTRLPYLQDLRNDQNNLKVLNLQERASKEPSVLILTPIRNAASHFDQYVKLLKQIDYKKDLLTLGILEGDSDDNTDKGVELIYEQLKDNFSHIKVIHKNLYPPKYRTERWQTFIQRERRSRLAMIRNELINSALDDQEWVLWIDSDVDAYPPDLIQQLLSAGRDIVTANCLDQYNKPFDLNAFRYKQESKELENNYECDGLIQPPEGMTRHYINEFKEYPIIEVDSVGGTVLFVRADLHRQGINFPPYPVEGLIETEAFSKIARKMGYRSWGLPQLIVRHKN